MIIRLGLFTGLLLFAAGPLFIADGPNAADYGAAEHYPVGSPKNFFEKNYMVGSFSHFDLIFPSHTVPSASEAWRFRRPGAAPDIEYVHAGNRFSIHDYLAHLPITGLLIARDDQILFEAYQYGRTDHDRFMSQSMSKTIVGMLTGLAVNSVADTAGKYIPELEGSPYGKITVRDLLHMSSGMDCGDNVESNPDSIDIATMKGCKQVAPRGTRFHYSAVDSQLLGLIVARVAHADLARYLDERIWKNIGAESNAAWTIDRSGHETAYCCFNAVLRDYARFGRLLAFDGAWNGTQLIPSQWMLDATTVKDSDSQLAPGASTPFFGYGYQLWIFPGPRRMFALLGANGQRIFVDPQSKLVMVQTAVMPGAVDHKKDAEMIGLWMALVRHFGTA